MSLLHKISLETHKLLTISFIPAQILETLRRPLSNKTLPCTVLKGRTATNGASSATCMRCYLV
jgi:hypothetical protein